MTNKAEEIKKGNTVIFTAVRLTSGNPVRGKIVSIDDEWIYIKLEHAIEGLVNTWYKGEVKGFRKSLITGLKKV